MSTLMNLKSPTDSFGRSVAQGGALREIAAREGRMKQNVLFVCVQNSAHSQIAEGLLTHLAGDRFHAFSGGLDPGLVEPLIVEVMREIGIDVCWQKSKWIYDVLSKPIQFSFVITVCSAADAERCPIFYGGPARMHWEMPPLPAPGGAPEARLAAMRAARDAIEQRIRIWLAAL